MNSEKLDKIESYVNDHLKEELKELDKQLEVWNSEIMEFIQLKNTVETMMEHLSDGFKTQMNIGNDIFMEAKIDNTEKILVKIGLDVYVEFTLAEAVKFADFKIRVLTKEAEVIRDESLKKRADIKIALFCLGNSLNLNTTTLKTS